ncbi:protein kinase domain-containing protein [Gordonia sp. NPDC003422]
MVALQPGARFAGYRIIRLLGEGGMGQVYLAEHLSLGRLEALKIISANPTDPTFHERFGNEARTAAALDHPGIVTLYTYGVENGSPWFSMSYLEGSDLNASPALPPADVSTIVTKVAEALDYAHGRGVIHRDIKPANILVRRDQSGRISRVTVLDFGIARLIDSAKMTATNLFIGTLAYAAPELLTGVDAGPASDQYALACTAFQLLTGRQPVAGDTPATLITGHLSGGIPRLSAQNPSLAWLDPVFARALAKRPEDRYASCSDFAAALARAVATASPDVTRVAAPTPPQPPSTSPPRQGPSGPHPGPFTPSGRPPTAMQPVNGPYPGYGLTGPPPNYYQGIGPQPGMPPGPSSGRRYGLIVAAVIGVLVVLGAIIGTTVALTGGNDDDSTTTTAGESTESTSSSAAPASGVLQSVAAGGDTTCAVKLGNVYCWGNNEYGAVGDGTTTNRTVPTRVPGISNATQVSVGGLGTTCAVAGGQAYCWGYGIGEGRSATSPTPITGLGTVTKISAGLTICAISDAKAYCWRNNIDGQVGTGNTASVSTPTLVAGISDVTDIDTEHTTPCAIAGGAPYCWGNNDKGQVGDGTTANRYTPTRVSGLTTATSIGTSLYSSCAVSGGDVYCWGSNSDGELGDGTKTNRLTPTKIAVSGATYVSAAAYSGCSAASSSAYCWGNRSAATDGTPARVDGVDNVTAVSISSATVCAISGDDLYCWGLNGDGQVGNGTTETIQTPVKVTLP